MRTGWTVAAVGATEIMLQNETAHTPGSIVFSLPAQPLHLPVIGMPVLMAAAPKSNRVDCTERATIAAPSARARTSTNSRCVDSRHMIANNTSLPNKIPVRRKAPVSHSAGYSQVPH